jgi:hypothetical protein
VAPALTQTVTLAHVQGAGDGSDYEYQDRVPYLYPAHAEGYGDGQVILGWRFVKGAAGVLALNVSDQRVTNVGLNFHASRVALVDLAALAAKTRTAPSGPQIVIATSNLLPSANGQAGRAVCFGESPSVAVGDYESDLAFGANAFSVVMALNITRAGNFARFFASFGWPLINFVDIIGSGDYAGYPKNGWGIWNYSSAVAPSLCWFNGWDGTDASKWRRAQCAISNYRYGTWAVMAISKAASSSAALASAGGATVTPSTTGTATEMAAPEASSFTELGARVRLFHSATPAYAADSLVAYTPANASFPGAAGLWVVSGALSQNEMNALTGSVTGLAAAMDPTSFASTYGKNIVFRTYAGERAWWPLGM